MAPVPWVSHSTSPSNIPLVPMDCSRWESPRAGGQGPLLWVSQDAFAAGWKAPFLSWAPTPTPHLRPQCFKNIVTTPDAKTPREAVDTSTGSPKALWPPRPRAPACSVQSPRGALVLPINFKSGNGGSDRKLTCRVHTLEHIQARSSCPAGFLLPVQPEKTGKLTTMSVFTERELHAKQTLKGFIS